MKLRQAVSWLTGTLQQHLFPLLEACWERPLTEKEQQLVSIFEVLQIDKFAGRPAQRFGRKLWERQARARAFVGKEVYNHPHTRRGGPMCPPWRASGGSMTPKTAPHP